jgi:hypothetical protein
VVSRLPEEAAIRIRQIIAKDLAPPPHVVNIKLFFAVTIGGILSLTLCGQFGMGVTGWAEALSHRLHQTMSPLSCAIICGTLFAVFPTLLLRLFLCSPMQFRAILRQKLPTLSIWYGGAGTILAVYSEHGQGADEILFWSISAILTSYLLAALMKAIFPKWSFPGRRYRSSL